MRSPKTRWVAWLRPLLLLLPLVAFFALSSCSGDGDDEEPDEQQTIDLTAIPLGDGYISTEPEVGNVFSCQVDFPDNAGGALVDGPWIDTEAGTWNAEEKVSVPGEVYMPPEFDISLKGRTRTISGNDIPDEPVGEFPVGDDTEAYEYDRNPNQILAQQFDIELPAEPEEAESPTCVSLGAIGVLLDGGYFFNALDGPGRDAVAHEIQDECDGHPERTGAYHYHSLSSCIEDTGEGEGHSPLVGYAIDGFGLYGRYGSDGETLTNDDLDECHGHTHEIEWDGEQQELYHYHATYEYPYTLGCYRGEPVEDEDLGALDPETAEGGAPDGEGAPPEGGSPP